MSAGGTSQHPGARSSAHSKRSAAAPQFKGKYLSLTTFKRNGTGVATPVWFVSEAGKILVVTEAGSYKVQRIRHNPSVTVAECTASGRLRSSQIPAHAQILRHDEAPRTEELMARKYRLDKIFILPVYHAVQAFLHGHRDQGDSVVLAITPDSGQLPQV